MAGYSALLSLGLALSAPWWLLRMATTGRYREGLRERLGAVPARLRATVAGRRVVWVHAVSVGEVLAVSRLVRELEAALNAGAEAGSAWTVVVSTTTRTGQAVARERFGAERVFFFPLDLPWAVRAYLRALRPALLLLAESELWPRLMYECERAAAPVAVVNARVSDRSFRRSLRVKAVWGRVLRKVTLWLAQSEEDARRLIASGVRAESVKVSGNLKFDIRAPQESRLAETLRDALDDAPDDGLGGRRIVVAGSTADGEDEMVVASFCEVLAAFPKAFLILAPRHPERVARALELAEDFGAVRATTLLAGDAGSRLRQTERRDAGGITLESNTSAIVLDTVGDLAAIYGLAEIAFVGGSLVVHGGQNPLEPAQFGVPITMGPSHENFRDVVKKLEAAHAIEIVGKGRPAATLPAAKEAMNRDRPHPLRDALTASLLGLLRHPVEAKAMGERGRAVFEREQGATKSTVAALLPLICSKPVTIEASEAVPA